MAGGAVAGDLDPEPDGVLVAVGADFLHMLDLAGGFALLPVGLTGAAPVPGFAGLDGPAQGFGVHVADHQDLARGVVGHDGGDQAVAVELRLQHRAGLDFGLVAALGEDGGRHSLSLGLLKKAGAVTGSRRGPGS